ncbi:ADP-ribosylglycohydrolase family protein [Rhodoferax antarcticus]|uniref:ADP-ribosylglycohydrolase family protein n=1 Tax=Rhodoferax antarcticus TaxID=81479 RepID=UPI00222415F0|nr:ADP-ribosylglycohydrolase family protein [Rhodoferax antarcticus]
MITLQNTTLDRARGALLGLAVGDAVGTTVEFMPRGSFAPLTEMVGGGPFRLAPGQFTDDTSMALCLAASLAEKGFDLHDQITRYTRWAHEGYMSSNGRCFDIGIATRAALQRFARHGDPLAGSVDPQSAGNGCLMRLAPVPIRYMHQLERAVQYSQEQARTTHQAPECLDASGLFGEILVRALQGQDKDAVLAPPIWAGPLAGKLQAIAQGRYRHKARDAIRGTGYVVDSLEATLWCFDQTENFRDCVLMAANLGDDADTTAAQAGQLAGAFYGLGAIPAGWLQKLAMKEVIQGLADALANQAAH